MAQEFTHISRQVYSLNGVPQVYPEMDEEHQRRARLELRQQLSSVLNDPAHPVDVGWNSNDLVVPRRPDIPAVTAAQFHSYYAGLREQWALFTANQQALDDQGDSAADLIDFTDPVAASEYLGVPRVYFEENFVIHEPATFREICGSSIEIASGNVMLQQRLSHFLDTVEVELVSQIGKRAQEFFEALTQIRELHAQVRQCVLQLQKVRRTIARTEEEVVTKSIAIPFLIRRRSAMGTLADKLAQLQSVVGVEQRVDSILAQGDFSGALDLIFSSQTLLDTQLSGIVALKDVRQRLNEKVEHIAVDMTEQLLAVTSKREFNRTEVEAIALPVFDGLLRFKKTKVSSVWESIREQMKEQILATVSEERKDITPLFQLFLGILSKLKFLREVMMMCTSDSHSAALLNQSLDSIHSICELQHTELAKFVTKLGLTSNFVAIYKETMDFVSSSETIAGKQCYSLRGCLMNQSKLFVDEFHTKKLRILSQGLDNEKWIQSKVASVYRHVVACIINERSIEEMLGGEPEGSPTASETLRIGDRSYCVVGSALTFVMTLSEYLRCLTDFPQLGADLCGRIARLFKLFNGRSAKLILGAEAMSGAAQLNRITSKHLALCSESVTLIGSLISHVKFYLAEGLTETQQVLLKDFDAIAHEYELHVQDIERKLVAIMNQMCLRHVKELRNQDAVVEWGAFPNQVSSYMEQIATKTRKLHSVVEGMLPPAQLQAIFRRIFVMYKDRLCSAYDALELPSRAARARVLTDINFLCETLHDMEGFDEVLGTPLTEHWSESSLKS